ncbi:MAG TPA: YrdB family protein [bacterium]|nr:YrdB family protein [bacterium]
MPALVALNLLLALLLELAALAALALWGRHAANGTAWQWPLALALPILFAIAWGRWAAPRAGRRLKGWKLAVFKLLAFSLAALALARTGRMAEAACFEGLALVHLGLARVWRTQEPTKAS